MSCMCFDSSERRLLTGASDGAVKMWNFSNGKVGAGGVRLTIGREGFWVIAPASSGREGDARNNEPTTDEVCPAPAVVVARLV